MRIASLGPCCLPALTAVVVTLVTGVCSAAERFPFQHHYIDRDLPGDSYGQSTLVDVDGDGDLDFITGGKDREKSVYWFEFHAPDRWTRHVLGTQQPSDVGGTALDVDGDGRPDHVSGGVWYRNPGQPRQHAFERIVFDGELTAVHDLVVTDLDRDGRRDVITMSDRNNLRWYRIPPDPRSAWERHDIGPGVHAGVATGDIDGDGDPDIARSNVWFENADGTAQRWNEHPVPFGKNQQPYPLSTRCVIADINRDGHPDLVMTENEIRAGRIAWLENADGRGGKFTVHDLPAGDAAPRGAYHSLAVADFDADGDLDIFTVEMEGIAGALPPRWFIWENMDGRGATFVERVILDAGLGGHEAVVADVDRDGDLDIAGKLWRPRKDNANAGRNHADFLENRRIVAPAQVVAQARPDSTNRSRLRLIVETDAGGDPDDEQSLVRFLLCTNEWDVEGIIANRRDARDGENLNTERTGYGIVQRQLKAYGQCWPNLVKHDPRYPSMEQLMQRMVPGHNEATAGVELIVAAVDRDDPRPLWYSDWGTDDGAAKNNLQRALDRVLQERGPDGYAKFKQRLRLSSAEAFGKHLSEIKPPFPLWVDTFRPPQDGKRWYHRFSALTATAGGFDVEKHVRTGHGPLGELYPLNTTHSQKEGDTMTFLYLLPVGLGDPNHPEWGSWGGRYSLQENSAGRQYYWAGVRDVWQGATSRDATLARWAAALQNDFRARLDWCVRDFAGANHPPQPQVAGSLERTARSGEVVTLDASASTDPDVHPLRFAWFFYPEGTGWSAEVPEIRGTETAKAAFTVPVLTQPADLHAIVAVTDTGSPPLTRYQRLRFHFTP